jgi:mono/diheme cytochrome c family protein
MTLRLPVCVLLAAAGLMLPATALASDASAGRALSEQWCSKCHNIENGAPFKLNPPSFASVAVYRAENSIRGKILSPHIGMPDIMWTLQPDDIDDIVAYITSLEAK